MTSVNQQDAESKPSQKSPADGHEYEEVLELIGRETF